MRGSVGCALFLLVFFPFSVAAEEPVFAENKAMMLEQMLGGGHVVGTRGFKIPTAEPKTRAIVVQRRDQGGAVETVTVKTAPAGVAPAAKLKIEFDIDSAGLRASSFTLLQELGQALNDSRVAGRRICISGHTDSDGTDDHNLRLSFARAEAVKSYLETAVAIPSSRMQVFGYGESLPLAGNESGAGKQLNRRVEVSLECPE
jgi:outer membrane protein OmpA-like peptidoglycan-associated protein